VYLYCQEAQWLGPRHGENNQPLEARTHILPPYEKMYGLGHCLTEQRYLSKIRQYHADTDAVNRVVKPNC